MILSLQHLIIIDILCTLQFWWYSYTDNSEPGSYFTTIFEVTFSGKNVDNNLVLFLHVLHVAESEPFNS